MKLCLKRQEKLYSMRRGDEQPCTLRRSARQHSQRSAASSSAARRIGLDRKPDARAMLPNIQGLRQKPCACSSRSPQLVFSVDLPAGPQVRTPAGNATSTRTYLLCCRTADLNASMASRAVAPTALDPDLASLAAKPACPCKHPEQRRAGDAEQPVTLGRRSRGLADGRTPSRRAPTRWAWAVAGPTQARDPPPFGLGPGACRWALLERGSVQSILDIAGALMKPAGARRRPPPPMSPVAVGRRTQKAVPARLGPIDIAIDEMAPAGGTLSVAALQSANRWRPIERRASAPVARRA